MKPHGGAFYGNDRGFLSLNTTKLTGPRVSQRMRCTRTGLVTGFKIHNRTNRTGESGYSSGSGPFWVRAQVYSDSGGLPATLLSTARYKVRVNNSADGFQDVTLDNAVNVTKGACYHFVVTIENASSSFWMTINGHSQYGSSTPAAVIPPGLSPPRVAGPWRGDDFYLLHETATGSNQWSRTEGNVYGRLPLLEVIYSDGWRDGPGYRQADSSTLYYVEDSTRLRQTWNESSYTITANGVWIYAYWISGARPSGALLGEIKDSGGNTLATASWDPSGMSSWDEQRSGYIDWNYASLDSVVLPRNQAFSIELSSQGGRYGVKGNIKGGEANFNQLNTFKGGYGQLSSDDGGSWAGVSQKWTGGAPRTDVDLTVLLACAGLD